MSGENQLNVTIKIAHPLLNRFVIGGNHKVGNLYAMLMYLPESMQHDPPKPNDGDVSKFNVGKTNV